MINFISRAGLVSTVLLSACTRLDSEVVSFDGRAVEIVDAGQGATTVVFEAGLGDDWRHWDHVASDIADDTRVFAYSRPGYGDSEDTDTPRDPGTIVAELSDLLATLEIPPPYVVVGHSFGGTYMELFARSYPDDTAGLVLVDSRPSDFLAECEAAELDVCGVPPATVDKKGGVFADEYDGFAEASDELVAAGPFGSYPVRVMTATRASTSDEHNALWASMHAEIAAEADDGEQILVDGHHYLQVNHESEVADVIREVLP